MAISASTRSAAGISVAWASALAQRDVVGASSATASLSCIVPPSVIRRRQRGSGQRARVLLEYAPDLGAIFALPFGVETRRLEHHPEGSGIRTIEHDTRLSQLRFRVLVEARDIVAFL